MRNDKEPKLFHVFILLISKLGPIFILLYILCNVAMKDLCVILFKVCVREEGLGLKDAYYKEIYSKGALTRGVFN